MLHHRVDQMDVGKIRIVEPQVGIGRACLTQQVARRDAGAGDEAYQQGTRRPSLEVLNDMLFDPGIADHGQRIARGSALGIVVDDDVARLILMGHSLAPALALAPSLWPISLSLRRVAISSRLASGGARNGEMRFCKYPTPGMKAPPRTSPSHGAGPPRPQ